VASEVSSEDPTTEAKQRSGCGATAMRLPFSGGTSFWYRGTFRAIIDNRAIGRVT
jgi:hypothetical protein